MYSEDHLFIEWLVSSCCTTVLLIGCLNFMSLLSRDVGCSSSAKFDKLLTSFTSICSCLWQSYCWARSPKTVHTDLNCCPYSQKTVVPVKCIFSPQLHHDWAASLHPKVPETLSHSTKQSESRAHWPTHDLGVHDPQLAPLGSCRPHLSDPSSSSKFTLSPLQLFVQPWLLSWQPPWITKIQLSLCFQIVLPLLRTKLWDL